jgi:hypothetical protein
VATDRQIAANRRNARRSTGPRSGTGRKRSSRNSFRHGLGARVTADAERIKRVERLARKIAGAASDFVALECAMRIAQAEFDLAQIHRIKLALISRVIASGDDRTPDALGASDQDRSAEAIRCAIQELMWIDRYERRAAARRARALDTFLEQKNSQQLLVVNSK